MPHFSHFRENRLQNSRRTMNVSSSKQSTVELLCYMVYPVVTLIFATVSLVINIFFGIVLVSFMRSSNRSSKYSISNPRTQLYKYLLVKTISDAVLSLVQIPRFAYDNWLLADSIGKSYVMQVWYVGFYYYIEGICSMFSGLVSVTAAFDVYATITVSCKWFKRSLTFAIFVSSFLLFCLIFYVYFILEFEIIKLADGTGYEIGPSNFTQTKMFEVFQIMHGGIRDCVAVVLLMLIDLLILYHFKKSMASKKSLLPAGAEARPQMKLPNLAVALRTPSSSLTNQNDHQPALPVSSTKKKESIAKADRNITRSFLINGVIFFLGHIFGFLNYCEVIPNNLPFDCVLIDLGELFYHVSCFVPVIVFIRTNKPIHRIAKALLTNTKL